MNWFGRKLTEPAMEPAWMDEPCAVARCDGSILIGCTLRTYASGQLAVYNHIWEE